MKINSDIAVFLTQFQNVIVDELSVNGTLAPKSFIPTTLDMLLATFLKKGKAENIRIFERLDTRLMWDVDGYTFSHPIPDGKYNRLAL